VPDPKKVRSVIPGTVTDVKVKEGQKVKAGEVLLLLEAMKMVNEIRMPFDGKIKKVNVEKGQKIPKDFVMIEID
jgi:pyruvate carboxylase subunit B